MRVWPLIALLPTVATAEITAASYADPTDVYGHGAVADGEYATLAVTTESGVFNFEMQAAVFEDTAPRLVDLDGDGAPEVIAVVSGFDTGAQIQIFAEKGGAVMPVAFNWPIGQRHRWLAIAGAADLDGDGRVEIAYVDRPHLAKTLRILEVRHEGDTWKLVPETNAENHTNHHLGSAVIEGGIRHCDAVEIITATGDWARIQATTLVDGRLQTRDLGAYDAKAMQDALTCD